MINLHNNIEKLIEMKAKKNSNNLIQVNQKDKLNTSRSAKEVKSTKALATLDPKQKDNK